MSLSLNTNFSRPWMVCGMTLVFMIATALGQADQLNQRSANRELADKILQDDRIVAVTRMAKELLTSGMNAGSGYKEVWIRDLNTFIVPLLDVSPREPVREALLTFFHFQGEDGNIIDGYVPKSQAGVGYKYRVSAAKQFHVATTGSDANDGSVSAPLKTISAAAQKAQPGDSVIVHAGVYRERIDPPRGGTSNDQRIVFQAAKGEQVSIKGSEVVKGWQHVQNDTWKAIVPNRMFAEFNPFEDVIHGDWFNPLGRIHHTGAVYLNGHWLTEAARIDDVLEPVGACSSSYLHDRSETLLNVAWLQPAGASEQAQRVGASQFASQVGVQTAATTEGGECIGWIESGDSVCYENVDFGPGSDQIKFRVASATQGGTIEVRLNSAKGEVLGTCNVPSTGGWQEWTTVIAHTKPLSGPNNLCLTFKGFDEIPTAGLRLWFAEVGEQGTSIWAQFQDVDPNQAEVEVNVRQSVFYPSKTGVDFITLRGFKMMHAATPWAPPTTEQIGLIGTNWSKGWIIEDNEISHSVCTGITLGKHGDQFDNTPQQSAPGYVETIKRATEAGWSKQNIGHHIVRNNRISHCEQAGIVGSMGAAFSNVSNNTIHDIHIRRLFTGAEMAGIKFHGAVDTIISQNRIFRCSRGIWLDWMAQGTRVSRNLLYENGPSEDLFMEVNHGPTLIDNNVMLSPRSILVNSQGAAFAHNLFNGHIHVTVGEKRMTPLLKAHSTEVVRLQSNPSGDERYYNNLFINGGLNGYDNAVLPVFMAGNVFLKGAKPSKHEANPTVLADVDPQVQLMETSDGVILEMDFASVVSSLPSELVTTQRLGKAQGLPYEQADGAPYRIDHDYFGQLRNVASPRVGPFAEPGQTLKVW